MMDTKHYGAYPVEKATGCHASPVNSHAGEPTPLSLPALSRSISVCPQCPVRLDPSVDCTIYQNMSVPYRAFENMALPP